MSSTIETAKIGTRCMQPSLFPKSPRGVCDEVKLNWLAALRLRDSGWLSFDPETTSTLNPAQEEELRFLGSLVAAGCDERMLNYLLRDLSKPYSYRIQSICYDWYGQEWKFILPDRVTYDMVLEWIKEQADEENFEELRHIEEMIAETLAMSDANEESHEEEDP